MKKFLISCFLPLMLAFSSCTKSPVELEIEPVGDTMAFNKTVLEVKAGAPVKLTFKNVATSPAMQHSWILVKPGTDAAVNTVALQAGAATNFIPNTPDVLARTKMLKPGETEIITFTAPATPGNYPYLCTFPGHYPMMKGTLRVL